MIFPWPATLGRLLQEHPPTGLRMLSVTLLALGVAPAAGAAPSAHSLYASRELWATIDVCNPKDQPNTVGVRGSMPGDGHPGDAMYMSFRLQYYDPAATKWADVSNGAEAGFQRVPAKANAPIGQDGRSFQLTPTSTPYRLRGVVSFQWRRGAHVVHAASRTTTPGHKSLQGADPPQYSAGTCKLG